MSTLDRCVDSTLLMAQSAPPSIDAATTAAALRERIARAKAEESAGRYPTALAHIEAVVTEAEALAYPPVTAAALHRRASIQERMGAYAAAEASGFAALAAAEAAGDDGLRAQIMTGLLSITGTRLQRFDEALHLSTQIRGSARRAWTTTRASACRSCVTPVTSTSCAVRSRRPARRSSRRSRSASAASVPMTRGWSRPCQASATSRSPSLARPTRSPITAAAWRSGRPRSGPNTRAWSRC